MKIMQHMERMLPCNASYLLIRVTFSTPTPPRLIATLNLLCWKIPINRV
jgi:hypothetical protein